jgi:hypothetical protein
MPLEDWVRHSRHDMFLYDWQTLIAGVLALIAGLITVREIRKQVETAVRLEHERVASEVDALRKSFAFELRLQIATALIVYDDLYGLGFMSNSLISGPMVEDKSRMAAPIIYPANAGKIGLLGAEAMNVMIVYDLLEAARNGAARALVGAPSPPDVMKVADAFLDACVHARGLLPKLRTGDPSRDAKDEALIQKINDSLAARRPA